MDWLDTLAQAISGLLEFSTFMEQFSKEDRIYILLLIAGALIAMCVCLFAPELF